MDPATHLLVTRKVIDADRTVVIAGLAADAPFYVTYPPWVVMQGQFIEAFRKNEWPKAPRWMQFLHHFFHSIPVLLTVGVVIKLTTGQWSRAALAWGLHILIDIPTHSKQNWAPQFLWPFSSITVDGFSWPEIIIPRINRVITQILSAIK